MLTSPLVETGALPSLGPIRLIYVASDDKGPVGLRRVPIESWIEHALQTPTGLDDTDWWRNELSDLGLGPDALTVVVDDGRMTEAARVWFILQYFGLPAAVLNGGTAALSALPPQKPEHEGALKLMPGSGGVGLRARDELKSDLEKVQILDARTAVEFSGEDLKGNERGGHLPNARHIAHSDLLNGSRLKSAPELAAVLETGGLTSKMPIVSHCNGGGRAALAALAAIVAGRSDVHVYYLSFADWAADLSCPLELPA